MVDGRRVWLASGRVPYARLPREAWAERIHAAKAAGLNTVETPIFWNRHEVRPGRFDFTGANDLRYFVDQVGKAGMYCILGIGPYVGADWDFGGLPPALCEAKALDTRGHDVGVALRSNAQTYLEACSRFISAVADQVRGWQVTAPGTGGPIILLQCESQFTCGHEGLAQTYLGELTRYIRESGLSVPIVNSNNLWQSVEGQIDGWAGSDNLLPTMRQLAAVREGQPRVVVDFAAAAQPTWGNDAEAPMSPRTLERRLAQTLAGGGQFNLTTFCGGTNFGFSGGRTDDGPDSYVVASADHGCALDRSGARTDLYPALRRVATFASRFGRVLSALDPSFQPVSLQSASTRAGKGGKKTEASPAAVSIVHSTGSQGGVAFVFAPEESTGSAVEATLLLSDGVELPVALGDQPVAWCLLGVNVSPRCRVDYANVSALGASGGVMAAFGPPGAKAVISVNGAPAEAEVPIDASPRVLTHDGLTIVLVRTEDAHTVAFGDDAVYVGVESLGASGEPLPVTPGQRQYWRIGADGRAQHLAFEKPRAHAPQPKAGEKIALSHWSVASLDEYAAGQSPRYAGIAAVGELTTLGVQSGYGWYRFALENERARKALLDFGRGGDRLHVYSDGRLVGIAGHGPGADRQIEVPLKKGPQTLVVLAENLGRFCAGVNLGEPKGVVDGVFEVQEIKPGKASIHGASPLPLLGFRAPIWDVAEGDSTAPERLTIPFRAPGEGGVLVRLDALPACGLLLLNGKPHTVLDRSGPVCILIDEGDLGKTGNTLDIAVAENTDDAHGQLERVGEGLRIFRVLSDIAQDAELSFAKWEEPAAGAYASLRSGEGQAAAHSHAPCWFRCEVEITPPGRGVYFEPVGLTKGLLVVNGKPLARYFASTRTGKALPPGDRPFIPASMLREGLNEIAVFDEHGASPARARLSR
ncbi:MAG TPA: beta-galactosidase [Phycisphaerales bacterium]|nr:beta-galactosidase [Phycisphaerales bacterium]